MMKHALFVCLVLEGVIVWLFSFFGRRNIFVFEKIYLFGPNQRIGNLKLFLKNLSLTNLS